MFASLFLSLVVFASVLYPVPRSDVRTGELLGLLTIQAEYGKGYDRKLFPHWSVSKGCTTRESVLRRDALVKFPSRTSSDSCKVVSGTWFSVYDGRTLYRASDLDVDHVVALSEAWKSGAHAWPHSRRKAFANDLSDPRSLRAVTDYVNQAKGDKDPSGWLPPHKGALCVYVSDWVAVKLRWKLSVDPREYAALRSVLQGSCQKQTTPAWSSP